MGSRTAPPQIVHSRAGRTDTTAQEVDPLRYARGQLGSRSATARIAIDHSPRSSEMDFPLYPGSSRERAAVGSEASAQIRTTPKDWTLKLMHCRS
jgi:hypothetical protein